MKNVNKVLVLISFFVILVMFTGTVSAANWTVNPGNSIQSIINNASTNDIITVNDNNGSAYTYKENLVINKTLQLKAKTGGNITIKALNSSNPVITVNSLGSGSFIQGFIIAGATNSSGIFLNGCSNCNINGNNLTGNYRGVHISNSNNNLIKNNVMNNVYQGIAMAGSNNTIQGNNIWGSRYGIYLSNSNSILITGNTITNTTYGINPQYSTATIQFNKITGSSSFGLVSQFNSNIIAINNWWGDNTPSYSNSTSSPGHCDIWNSNTTVTYNPWLVLKVTANPSVTKGNSTITADLTHNSNGADTSLQGNIPDDLHVNFLTTRGTVTNTVYTRNGKASATFSPATGGTAYIMATFDNQTVQTIVLIDTNPPAVVSLDPVYGAVNVSINKVIKVTFSEPIKVGSNWIELTKGDGTLIPITTSINGNVLTVDPVDYLTNCTLYHLGMHTGSLTDLVGNSMSFYSTHFTVGVLPTVTSADPDYGSVNVPINKVIKVTFDKPIKAGTNWIELKNDDETLVPITTSISGNVLTITPNNNLATGTHYSLILHTGSVTDLSGNNISVVCGTIFTTNGTELTVTSSDPADDALNVPINKVIKVTFNGQIKSGNKNVELTKDDGTLIPITTSISGNVLTITHNSNLTAGTDYTLILPIGSVTDLSGNPLSLWGSSFTTDGAAPNVTNVDPDDDALNVPINKVIKVTFSEPIKAGNNWIELTDDNETLIPITTSISGNVLTITPNNNLTKGTHYTLLIHTGSITDLSGNSIRFWGCGFTTDGTVPTITSSDPTDDAVNVPINKKITITFNEIIKAGNNWIELKKDDDGTLIPITTSIIGNFLTVTPNSTLDTATHYTLLIHTGSVTDLSGNSIPFWGCGFTTDGAAPYVISTDPNDNAANVPTNKVIKVTFSESIKAGSNWIELKKDDGTLIPITTSISGNVLTVIHSNLDVGTHYTLLIHTGSVTDLSGNSVKYYDCGFTTIVSVSDQYLTASSSYCPINDPRIKSLASSITSGITSAYDKAVAIFNWVNSNTGYRYYRNPTNGALTVMKGGNYNCADLSNLIVALTRAAGIPARFHHGYCQFSKGADGHYWAEVYVNGNWYKADASSCYNTFGHITNWSLITDKGWSYLLA